MPRKRATSRADDERNIRLYVLPALKHCKVAEVRFADIDGLHRQITKKGATVAANRVIALVSKMFNLAIRWGWRTDNPAMGVERNVENKRTRYLTGDELACLTAALAQHEDQQAANIIRMLLLSGARRGEVLGAHWDQFDLTEGIWTKPGSTTKRKTEHCIPLSAPLRQLLAELRAEQKNQGRALDFVFPGEGKSGHRFTVAKNWRAICKAADLRGLRLHDLRHNSESRIIPSAAVVSV